MKECRCPVCNSRIFDIQCGRVTIRLSSEYTADDEIVVRRLCKCKAMLLLTFESTR